MTPTTNPNTTTEVDRRISAAVANSYDGGIWEGRKFNSTDEFVTIRLDDLNALRASQAATEGGWLPIESAPKDGTHVLACHGPYSATRGFNQGPPAVVHYWDEIGNEGFYLSLGAVGQYDRALPFTHWTPLPNPPVSA